MLEADLVVLSTPLAPHEDNRRLAEMLGVSVDQHGFFSGNDPMHPLETNKDGVFICGSSRWPVSAHQAIAQGEAAAVKAASILRKCRIEASSLGVLPESLSLKAEVNPTICSGCGSCVSACPFEACYVQEGNGAIVAAVDELKCKGCGSCVSVCPNGAIQIQEESSSSIFEMLTNMLYICLAIVFLRFVFRLDSKGHIRIVGFIVIYQANNIANCKVSRRYF